YGILLHSETFGCVQDLAPGYKAQTNIYNVTAPSPVVAVNPQCYDNPDMACDAIKRAKELINRQGLHLAEHILLRPRCEEDCECRIEPCPNPFDKCEFPFWKDNDEEDICDVREPVCFKPGHDPYSFIATVALPAWPASFRKKGNRELV